MGEYWGYIGIMEKKMETIGIIGFRDLGFEVQGLGSRLQGLGFLM